MTDFVVVYTDGDADYTSVYAAPEGTTRAEAEAMLPEDDGDGFWRVITVGSPAALAARLDGTD